MNPLVLIHGYSAEHGSSAGSRAAITRIYGSLTTFNVLFKYKEDNFAGEKSR